MGRQAVQAVAAIREPNANSLGSHVSGIAYDHTVAFYDHSFLELALFNVLALLSRKKGGEEVHRAANPLPSPAEWSQPRAKVPARLGNAEWNQPKAKAPLALATAAPARQRFGIKAAVNKPQARLAFVGLLGLLCTARIVTMTVHANTPLPVGPQVLRAGETVDAAATRVAKTELIKQAAAGGGAHKSFGELKERARGQIVTLQKMIPASPNAAAKKPAKTVKKPKHKS